jgi:PAS domain S-box-containing protein
VSRVQWRVLCLEDDPRDAELIATTLEREGLVREFTRVDSEAGFRAALERGDVDLILADYSLPGFDGLTALRIVRETCPSVPFVFVSGTLGEEVAIEAIKDGATDYVLKERLARLLPAVRRALTVTEERTRRERAEAAARLAQCRFEGIVEIADDAIISVDSSQRIVLFNRGAERLFGYPRSEIVGHPLDLLLPAGAAQVHRRHIEEFARAPEVARRIGERRKVSGRRKDGSEFPAEGSVSKLALGGEWLFTVILRDVTARRQAEAAAERSARQLRDAIDTIPAMVFACRPDGSTEYVNRRWQEYAGFSAAESERFAWIASVHPEDADSCLAGWRASLASGEPFESEARVRSTAGEYRWFLVRAVPLRDEARQIVRWYGKLTDIEDRRRAEEALRRSEASLAEQRERLRRLEADLARINRVSTMGELTASLAHEINQPIAAAVTDARTCLRWLARAEPDLQEARDAAARIVKDTTRAADIVNRVRQLFRRSPPAPEPLDLSELVREIVALVSIEASLHGIAIRTELDDRLPAVLGDRVQLQQMLLNLILNAIESTRGVTGPREVTLVTRADAGGHVLVSVADTGEGLPGVDPAALFEAFFTTKPDGTGMGLAISRSIVEAHSGQIRAEGNEAGGATFVVTLPVVAPAPL